MATIVISALVGTGFVGLKKSGNGSGGQGAAELAAVPGSYRSDGATASSHAPTGKAAPATAGRQSVSLDKCRAARKGLRWYRGWFRYWTHKMGAANVAAKNQRGGCPRYLSKVFRAKAHQARKAYEAWYVYHYHWWEWLPANWQALGACETGYGKRPGNFEHSNSRFTSAFGISWAEYDADAAYYGSPPWHVRHTPRDQYNAALGHLARFGDGWTCPGP